MTMHEIPAVRHYQGWQYTYDDTRKVRERWQATRRGVTLASGTESGLKQRIDDALDATTQELSHA